MEMKPGYKETEVGVIPEEWDVKAFGEIAVPRRERFDPRRNSAHDFCIELEHIESGSGRILGSSRTGAQSSLKSVFHPGDVLFGKLRAYLRKYWRATRAGVCSTEIWALVPRDGAGTSEFLFQIVQTNDFIDAASNSYGTHMPRSDWNVVKNHKLKMPSLPEQRAIAEALSDVDGLLGGLDRLIAKKRELKQAAMQQLLSGQTRLPGYSGEWETKRLGDRVTRLPKTKRLSSDGELEGRYPFFTNSTQPVDRYLDEKDFDQEAIIANTGGVAYFDYFNGPFAAMADCMVLSAQDNVKWLFYLLKTLEPFINNTGFTGSGIKHLDKEFFFGLNVHIATSPEEQAAIAGTLTAMDSELGALVARRDKTRALKHGMMQELLTGRTRLVPVEVRHA